MFHYLLVMLEGIFWCFLFLMALSIQPSDSKYIDWMRNYNNRQIGYNIRSNEMKTGKWRTSDISKRKVVNDCTFTSTRTEVASVREMRTHATSGKRFMLHKELAKLKYSNELRKICYYNQIKKVFSDASVIRKN